jgi:16S rRNA (cytosine1402-N4)-methyltransferase
MTEQTVHKTVLLQETIDALNLNTDSKGSVVDGTLGGGGHTKLLAESFPEITIYAFDLDADAISRSKELLAGHNVTYINKNFKYMKEELEERGVKNVEGIILDLGFSSDQLEQSGRGFSFQKDEPLQMTLSKDGEVTAEVIVNEWAEETLADIIYGFGEERYSRRIAKAIVEARQEKRIKTTFELVDIVRQAVPASYRNGKINPATKTFQALRIATNEELEVLKTTLEKGFDLLAPGGRFAIISFHSLEDRIVKRFFREKADADLAVRVTKKPIVSTQEELQANPRARSAKLRILEKK